ncbi:chorismate mutase [Candidatus Woesearchaeota archaeon]|nr:chorismate mutase [Candidatus Woesearchaeota archaeon]
MDMLNYYRKKIDSIDKKIIKCLLLRFKLVRQIAIYKKRNKIKITDKERELQVIKNIKKYSDNKNKKFLINIFKRIINYSKVLQRR